MSQNDFNIANQGFPATRADINSALQALASNSAGTAEPSTTYAYQFWYDETNELLKMRNSDNDAWITIGTFDQVADTFTPAGVTTDKIEEGNSSVEVVDTGTGYVAITVDGVEAARVDANGRLGIGTTSPSTRLTVGAGAGTEEIRVDAGAGWADLTLNSNSTNGGHIYFNDGSNAGEIFYYHVSDYMAFNTAATERMRIDSSGNVGIGTSSPSYKLNIKGDNSASGGILLQGTAGSYGLQIYHDGPADTSRIYNYYAGPLLFGTNNTERMRIDSSGNLLVGTTSDTGGRVNITNNGIVLRLNTANTSNTAIQFVYNGSAQVGGITTTTTSTAYNTSSDYRLKENVTSLDGAADRLSQIPVHRFNFIADPDTIVDGFLAHEVQAFVPEAVTGEKDGTRLEQYEVEPALGEIYTPAQPATYDEDGVELTPATDEVIHSTNVERPAELLDGQQWRETTPAVMDEREVPEYQGIDQSKLVPLLTAALQEALQKIDALEARVTALGG